jgi:hypothetical protein
MAKRYEDKYWKTRDLDQELGPIANACMTSRERELYRIENFCPSDERDQAIRDFNEEYGGFCASWD